MEFNNVIVQILIGIGVFVSGALSTFHYAKIKYDLLRDAYGVTVLMTEDQEEVAKMSIYYEEELFKKKQEELEGDEND